MIPGPAQQKRARWGGLAFASAHGSGLALSPPPPRRIQRSSASRPALCTSDRLSLSDPVRPACMALRGTSPIASPLAAARGGPQREAGRRTQCRPWSRSPGAGAAPGHGARGHGWLGDGHVSPRSSGPGSGSLATGLFRGPGARIAPPCSRAASRQQSRCQGNDTEKTWPRRARRARRARRRR